MAYLAIDNFQSGLDTRKSILTAPAGSLTRLVNAAVTPGGEIAKRRAFVKVATLTGTKGLAAVGSKVVAFKATGATATPPDLGMPLATLEYHSLPSLSSTAKMIDYDIFDGNIYTTWYDASASTAANKNPHYYFEGSAADGITPSNAYVKTEGSGKGYYLRSYQSKMYTLNDKYIYFSAIKYPVLWEEASKYPPSGAQPVSELPVQGYANERLLIPSKRRLYTWTLNASTGIGNWVDSTPSAADLLWIDQQTQRTGAGYINTSLQETGGKGLQGIDIYYDKLAVFSGETCQLWAMDPDPNQNALSQVLRATGTLSPKSVSQYGSGDVLYLAPSGIRSLKARDASNSAAVTDIGSPIDQAVRDLGVANGRLYLANAQAILEPVNGRFWMVFPQEIYVLSWFPGPKINAWSVYKVPFTIDYIVTAGDYVFIRSGDDLYLFGGKTGLEYDDSPVEVRFPFLDAGKPATNKMFEALDTTVEGVWTVKAAFNYNAPDAEELLGTISEPTWSFGRFAMQGVATHVSMRFYNNSTGPATLSNAAIHYQMSDTI